MAMAERCRDLLLIVLPAVASLGCGERSHTRTELGALGFELALPRDVNLDEVTYTINGPGSYASAGALQLTGPWASRRARIDRIPVGHGYTLRLEAARSVGACGCTAPFEVARDSMTTMAVKLSCPAHHGHPEAGSLRVIGSLNFCPTIDSVTAIPSADSDELVLRASASDQDGLDSIRFTWSSGAGELWGNEAEVRVPCAELGSAVDAVVRVSDGDCADEYTMPLSADLCLSSCSDGQCTDDASSRPCADSNAAGESDCEQDAEPDLD